MAGGRPTSGWGDVATRGSARPCAARPARGDPTVLRRGSRHRRGRELTTESAAGGTAREVQVRGAEWTAIREGTAGGGVAAGGTGGAGGAPGGGGSGAGGSAEGGSTGGAAAAQGDVAAGDGLGKGAAADPVGPPADSAGR